MLRIGCPPLANPLFDAADGAALGGLSPMSSMLLTGERGVNGEGARPAAVAPVEFLAL